MIPRRFYSIAVRFAPSPTGDLHIGGLRTALINYLFARKSGGRFLLRIEDTDRSRFVDNATSRMINALAKLGIEPDGDITHQSDNLLAYSSAAESLIESGNAYRCFCSPERLENLRKSLLENGKQPQYDGRCRTLEADIVKRNLKAGLPHVVRLKVPSQKIRFSDIIYGKLSFEPTQLDDQVLLKTDGYPTYHLANVVDDHNSGISHVIRGEEWLTSTPKHIILYEALGWNVPLFAHVPNMVNSDGTKISKRRSHVSVLGLLESGYSPQVILSFLSHGWGASSSGLLTISELVDQFDLESIGRGRTVLDMSKLDTLNREFLLRLWADRDSRAGSIERLRGVVGDGFTDKYLEKCISMFVGTASSVENVALEGDYLFCPPQMVKNAVDHSQISAMLSTADGIHEDDWKLSTWMEKSQTRIDKKALRVLLTGKLRGPPLGSIVEVLGKGECTKRLTKALSNSS